jgi:aldose 1-epimerase
VQYEIHSGGQWAAVTEVGATLRAYTVDGTDVIDGFPLAEQSSAGRGQVLAPWPNRLADGRYTFEGRAGRAALDEPEASNAIHGLVRWLPWQLGTRSENAVVLGCVLHPQPGYPWRLELQVEYRLGQDGLTVTAEATNLADTTAPFGIGFHPYLTVGTRTVGTAWLLVPARRRLVTDARGLPTGQVDVAGTEFDFTAGRLLGPIKLDTGYTDLVRGNDGRACARLKQPDGDGDRSLTVWVDAAYEYLMVFTGDTVDPVERRRRAVAIEPMTCPPNALVSGTDVIWLDPGAAWAGSWGITTR